VNSITDVWEEVFAAGSPPAWLTAFDEDPYGAVEALLWRRFYHGSLNLAEPEDLVIDWVFLIGEAGEFTSRLDQTLRAWGERNWGSLGDGSTARLADAWSRLADIVAATGILTSTAQALRVRFADAQEYLGGLSVSPSQDPLGRYLGAIARYQQDRTLAPFWWQLCELPDRVPFYHAPYAIEGLRGLPPLEAEERGAFRLDLVHGLIKLAVALARKRQFPEKQIKEMFFAVARRTMAAYPFPERWVSALDPLIPSLQDPAASWLAALLAERATSQPGERTSRKDPRRDQLPRTARDAEWKERADSIARALERRQQTALAEAEALIKEERSTAAAQGHPHPLVLSLNRFASIVAAWLPQRALKWAEEARLWEPSHAFCWTTLTKALRYARGPEAALPIAWTTVERFPEDAVAWRTLGQVLSELERLGEAEEVYRQAWERFPGDVASWTGLADLLKNAGRLEASEAVYKEACTKFPYSEFAWNGLADVLKESGRLEEAENLYREILPRLDTPVTWNGLGDVLKLRRKLDEAEETYRTAVKRFPGGLVARIGLASVLRLKGADYLPEALRYVEEVLARDPRDAPALDEQVRILGALGRFEQASRARRAAEHAKRPPVERLAREEHDEVSPPKAETPKQAVSSPPHLEQVVSDFPHAEEPREAVRTGREAHRHDVPFTAPTPPSESQLWKLVARTSEARFLRRWARRMQVGGDDQEARRLKERAKQQLEGVLRERAFDGRAAAEMGLLLLAQDHLDEAHHFVEEKLAKMPASPATALALARARRLRAEQRGARLDDESEAILVGAARGLREADAQLEPLVRLELGRGYLALRDGAVRTEKATRQFQRLRESIADVGASSQNGFWHWWSQEVRSSIFDSVDVGELDARDLATIEANLGSASDWVDTLEEDLGFRFSRLPV
jgi:tetratricopeptide (TPR) repeat protein